MVKVVVGGGADCWRWWVVEGGGVRGCRPWPMDAPGAPGERAQEKEKEESTEKKEKKEGRHVLGAPAFQPFPTHGG